MATMRQILANRQNSLRSTGPRSASGKRIASRNSVIHGLSGAGVVLPDQLDAEVLKRFEEWHSSIKPFDPFETRLLEQLCIETVRIDAAHRDLVEIRRRRAERAATSWDADRRTEAEELALKLSQEPTTISRKLKQTLQGCDVLIDGWQGLIDILDEGNDWNDEQRQLAFDLLGIRVTLRSQTADDRDTCRALAQAEIDELRRLQEETLDEQDAAQQAAAEMGVGLAITKEEAQIQRYLAACRRRLEWAKVELRRDRGGPRSSSYLPTYKKPASSVPPAPSLAASIASEPPLTEKERRERALTELRDLERRAVERREQRQETRANGQPNEPPSAEDRPRPMTL
jgi:hypothetical protein